MFDIFCTTLHSIAVQDFDSLHGNFSVLEAKIFYRGFTITIFTVPF